MAQQTIGIGTVANDGTGDTIRDAFDKANDNFTELYAGLTGLLDFKGSTDCSANPNYPAASKGDFYLVSVAGKIGGASGLDVEAGDSYFATADNAGGNQATVGASWTVIQGNITAYLPLSGGTLTGDLAVPAEAYGVGWNGSNEVPTKNDVYDKIEAVVAAGGGATSLDGLSDVDTTGVADGDTLTYDNGTSQWVPTAPSGGGSAIEVQDEGSTETAALVSLNFTGAGVTATDDGSGNVEVAIPGGSSFRGAMVKKTADQTAANYSTDAAVAWDGEDYDTDSIHDNVTNNTRLTVPSGVTYVRVGFALYLSSVSNGSAVRAYLKKNGSEAFRGWAGSSFAVSTQVPNLNGSSGPIPVTAGDYFELFLVCGDSSITVVASDSNFWMEVIA